MMPYINSSHGITNKIKTMSSEDLKRLAILFERIINQVNHNKNTSGIDRTPAIKRLAEQGLEILNQQKQNNGSSSKY